MLQKFPSNDHGNPSRLNLQDDPRESGFTVDKYTKYTKDYQHSQDKDSNNCSYHEQQAIQFRQSIGELQCKIQGLEKEKESMLDMRQEELKRQEEAKKQLQITVQELQAANQLQDELLKQSRIYNELLK
ncbi:hypothetical protein GDO86_000790, partial [Hymenochirus boettgeri]